MKKGLSLRLCKRKGNAALDTLMVMIVLFAFILTIYWSNVVYQDINADIQADDSLENNTKEIMQNMDDRFAPTFDYGFLTIFILLWILLLVASFQVDSNPVFFVIMIVVMIFVFIVAANLGNTYEEIVDDGEDLTNLVPSYPVAHFIMSHLLQTIIVMAFTVVIVQFGKNQYLGGT